MKLESIAECDYWICFVKLSVNIYTFQGFLIVMWGMKKIVICPQQMIPDNNIPSWKAVVLLAK